MTLVTNPETNLLQNWPKWNDEQRRRYIRLKREHRFKTVILPKILNGDDSRPGPLYWLQECTMTRDEKWSEHGFVGPNQPFPHLPYMPYLFDRLLRERRLWIPKSRELMLSWSVIGYGVWLCQTRPGTRVIVQSEKEQKVVDLIKGSGAPGYARTLYECQSDRLKKQFPLTKSIEDMSATEISWKNGSVIVGVPGGPDQIRSAHPTCAIFDEAAFIEAFMASWSGAEPVCHQMIAVSSVQPSAFWDGCRRVAE